MCLLRVSNGAGRGDARRHPVDRAGHAVYAERAQRNGIPPLRALHRHDFAGLLGFELEALWRRLSRQPKS